MPDAGSCTMFGGERLADVAGRMIMAADPVQLIRGEARPPEWFRCEACGTRARYEVPLPTGGVACVACSRPINATDKFKYASWVERASASMIDLFGILACLLGFNIVFLFAVMWLPLDKNDRWTMLSWIIWISVEAGVGALYFWLLESSTRTIGGRFVGTRVVREQTWGSPGPVVGFVRLLAKVLTIATLGLGVVIMLHDPERRALHDRIAGTRVIED